MSFALPSRASSSGKLSYLDDIGCLKQRFGEKPSRFGLFGDFLARLRKLFGGN